MGLDMFLYARPKNGNCKLNTKLSEIAESSSFTNEGIVYEAIYWRKANSIHNWFVENVQDGVDECGEYEVSIQKLQELVDIINTIGYSKELAFELLPPISGYFFGSTEIDEWYFDTLKETKNKIESLLEISSEDDSLNFSYSSSW